MPRRPRASSGNYIYHVLNRAAGRRTLFEHDKDYEAFLKALSQARTRIQCRILAYCVMPNHWHLVLWPKEDGDLSSFMHWLTTTHSRRVHLFRGTTGAGPIYEGRYKSFAVQCDDHFYLVCRYVERNALSARLVSAAENWKWSSLWQTQNDQLSVPLDKWPIAKPEGWTDWVNAEITNKEKKLITTASSNGLPLGELDWKKKTAEKLGLPIDVNTKGDSPKGDGFLQKETRPQ